MPATITWTKDGASKTATVPDSVLSVLQSFIAAQVSVTVDPTTHQPVSVPRYTDIPDLIFKHCVSSLIIPLMQNSAYQPTAVAQATLAAQAAQGAAMTAVATIISSIQTS